MEDTSAAVQVVQDDALARSSGRRLRFWDAFKAPAPTKPIHEDACVRTVISEGWGMQELQAKIKGDDIGCPLQFEALDAEALQRDMRAYFEDEIEIVPPRDRGPMLPNAPLARSARNYIVTFTALGFTALLATLVYVVIDSALAWATSDIVGTTIVAGALGVMGLGLGGYLAFAFFSWLLMRLLRDNIWPGLMEERLNASIKRKFPKYDADIRRVIDHYAHVFLESNWMLVRLKRFFQFAAIIGFYVSIAPLMTFVALGQQTPAMISVAGAVFAVTIIMWGFGAANSHIYKDKYLQSLRISAQHVANLIRERMTALSLLLQQTVTHVTQTQLRGEQPSTDPNKLDDNELRTGTTFFATQLQIWLAKRLEYIELHLHNRIHIILAIEAIISIAGLVMYMALMIIGLAPAALVVLHYAMAIATPQTLTGDIQGDTILNALAICGGLLVIVMTLWVSRISFYREAWNPLKTMSSESSVLDQHFDSQDLGGWQTFVKQKLHIRLAARAQRASFVINDYFKKMGRFD